MGKYHFTQYGCPECHHIWWLISNQPIDVYIYYAWIINVIAEHEEIREEREKK